MGRNFQYKDFWDRLVDKKLDMIGVRYQKGTINQSLFI